jgi:hypothetical protein
MRFHFIIRTPAIFSIPIITKYLYFHIVILINIICHLIKILYQIFDCYFLFILFQYYSLFIIFTSLFFIIIVCIITLFILHFHG